MPTTSTRRGPWLWRASRAIPATGRCRAPKSWSSIPREGETDAKRLALQIGQDAQHASDAPLAGAHLREPGAGARGSPARVERTWPAGAGFETTRARAPDYYRAAGVLSEVEAMRTGDPRTGRTLLDSAIAAGPFKSALPAERPYTDLAFRYARLGDAARARSLLSRGGHCTRLHPVARCRRDRAPSRSGRLPCSRESPPRQLPVSGKASPNNATCYPCFAAAMRACLRCGRQRRLGLRLGRSLPDQHEPDAIDYGLARDAGTAGTAG